MSVLLDKREEENVIKSYIDGVSVSNISKSYKVSAHVIYTILHKNNVKVERICPTKNLEINKVLELYNHGIGVAGIANRLGFTRTQMISFFKRNNIPMRNAREQQIERMKYSTSEQIAHLVEAAHKACKGKKISATKKKNMALGKYKKQKVKSKYEKAFIKILNEMNIKFEYQFPIGSYNVDFLINNNVIIEIFGGGWHSYGYHKNTFPERTRFILKNNYSIIFVFTDNEELFIKEIKEIVLPMINTMKDIDKGKYKILWNNGKYSSSGDESSVETALIRPYTAIRNKKTGRFESVRRQVNFIKA